MRLLYVLLVCLLCYRALAEPSAADYSGCWTLFINGEEGEMHFDISSWGSFSGWAVNHQGVRMDIINGYLESNGNMRYMTCPGACMQYKVTSTDARVGTGTAQLLGFPYIYDITQVHNC